MEKDFAKKQYVQIVLWILIVLEADFVLIITNDSGYYSQDISEKNVLDSNFSFHHGVTIEKSHRYFFVSIATYILRSS